MSLPIDHVIPEIIERLRHCDQLVLQAPPGAGKTTGVPLALLDQPWLGEQKILLLEPRRLAARAAAERMAELLGEKTGERVGYRVRLESRVSSATRIEVITEGILTRMLQDDPSLDGVGLLIFDEFHERSLDADLGLALALQGRELFGDSRKQTLKLLVMSATLDGDAISQLIDAPIVTSAGKMYPVRIEYGQPWQQGEWIVDRVLATIRDALEQESGSLLVFLPGQGEIREAQRRLQEWYGSRTDVLITPLFGDLNLNEQRLAIAPAPVGKRKIVLATSIAETSLTIDGVRVVIDAGLSRLPSFDPNTGMTRLHTKRVSKAAAIQRAGRAGRLEPGSCYRLWSESQQESLSAFTPAEILQADLTPLVLQLLRWGVSDPAELQWLDQPPVAAYQQALDLLLRLQAINKTATGIWQLTAHGAAMAALPLHPRLAHMLLIGQRYGLATRACQLAALLGERDLLREGQRELPTDIQLRLHIVDGDTAATRAQKPILERIKQQAQQFSRALDNADLVSNAVSLVSNTDVTDKMVSATDSECWTGFLLACAYPDRIAQARSSGNSLINTNYKLSNGRSAVFVTSDSLQQQQWLVVTELGSKSGTATDRIFLAATLDKNLFEKQLQDLTEVRTLVEWDNQQDKLIAEQQRCIGELILERKSLTNIPAEAKQQALLALVRKRGLSLFNWTDTVKQLCARVELLRAVDGKSSDTQPAGAASMWPNFSEHGLLNSLEEWLAPYLDRITHLRHFAELDIYTVLLAQLPWAQQQRLEALAPVRYQVPSGSMIAIDYAQTPPVLAVKLQEMFGCQQNPTIADGKVPLLIHLLSPARRPIQVTKDLAGFWQGSYELVKKDMKSQYPRHQWPDDPLAAVPTAKTAKPRVIKS